MPTVGSMVAVAYVRDIDASRAFYGLLGFSEHSAGRAETSAWTALRHNEFLVLLASTAPPLDLPQLPLLFYFFYDDLEAVIGVLEAAGVQATRTGHPPHALGGEAKVVDPDGNILLLGQRERSASHAGDDASARFSLPRVFARGGTAQPCRVRNRHGDPCPGQGEVKLADSRGDAAWVCLAHAEEILVTVPTAFIASQDDQGINSFLLSHRLPTRAVRP